MFGHEDDFLYWPPMVADETVDVEGVTFLVQQVDEDFVMNTLVLQPWAEDQIIPIPQQLMSYLKDLGTDSDYQLAKLTRIPILLVYAVGVKAALTLMSLAVTLSKLTSPELGVEDVKVTGTLTADFFEVIG